VWGWSCRLLPSVPSASELLRFSHELAPDDRVEQKKWKTGILKACILRQSKVPCLLHLPTACPIIIVIGLLSAVIHRHLTELHTLITVAERYLGLSACLVTILLVSLLNRLCRVLVPSCPHPHVIPA
jgi:hypothetical protein